MYARTSTWTGSEDALENWVAHVNDSVAPMVAGMGSMNYRRFVSFNVIGGFAWVVSMTFIGYFLGQFPWVRKNIEIVILIVVFLSILPGIIAFGKEWLKKRRGEAAEGL